MSVDELEGVPIPSDDQDIPTVVHRLLRQRRDYVVSLIALPPKLMDLESVENLVDQGELAAEMVGCLLSLCFVIGIGLGAKSLS